MKTWRLVLRSVSNSGALQDAAALKRNVANFLRVVETYEVQCLGIPLFVIDFYAKDDEFNHVMRMVRIIEKRYRLSVMQLSELAEIDEPSVTIKVGCQPATYVA
ncbi:hypothetical protein [Billgrantia antri]|uniref:hypothetical protein n=1 Tax=Billgrantia antri TaxID=2846777 RepID=UPI003B20E53B